MDWENHFQKNQMKEKTEKSMSKCLMLTKKTTSEEWKIVSKKKTGPRMTLNGLGKPFRKKSDSKNRKEPK